MTLYLYQDLSQGTIPTIWCRTTAFFNQLFNDGVVIVHRRKLDSCDPPGVPKLPKNYFLFEKQSLERGESAQAEPLLH